MGSEVEIPETPNWLKDLEAKREKRLRRKLGHELGAGALCLTCKEKCPGLDLHFWRKICKNCKCSKENHEVQDDDIYGWAQEELLGTKVSRLRQKIKLPGRKDEVELEWAPTGQKETIDKYLKTLPPELLPIKGSQAAQDRKQLLQKQIPVHDIDPTLCHELTDEELKKMQEYVAHIKESSVGVGHLIQISFIKGKTHVLDKNDAMFLINNVPKGIASSESVTLKSGNNIVPLRNVSKESGDFESNQTPIHGYYQPNCLISNQVEELTPVYSKVNDKFAKLNENIKNNNINNLKQISNAQGDKIVIEDPQFPLSQSIKSLNYPENVPFQSDNKELNSGVHRGNLVYNSNIKNLVPSAFVPVKHSTESYADKAVQFSLDEGKVKELPYPSQFINDQFKYGGNLNRYNPGNYNILNEHQNPAFFEPIKDIKYFPDHVTNEFGENEYNLRNEQGKIQENVLGAVKPTLHYPENFERHSQAPMVSGGVNNPNQGKNRDGVATVGSGGEKLNQNDVHLSNSIEKTFDDHQKPSMIKNLRDLAYSTYDSPPANIDEDFQNLSVKDRLNRFKEGNLPTYTPKGSPVSSNLSPSKFQMHNQRYNVNPSPDNVKNIRDQQEYHPNIASSKPNIYGTVESTNPEMDVSREINHRNQIERKPPVPNYAPGGRKPYGEDVRQTNTKVTTSPSGKQPFSNYAPEDRNTYGEDLQQGRRYVKNSLTGRNALPNYEPLTRNVSEEDVQLFSNCALEDRNTYGEDLQQGKRYIENTPTGRDAVPSYGPMTRNVPEDDVQLARGNTSDSPVGRRYASEDDIQSPRRNMGTLPNYSPMSRNVAEDDVQLARGNTSDSPVGRRYASDDDIQSSRRNIGALPNYSPGSRNIYEDDLQPTYIPVGGIRDIDFENPVIRTALSRDNDLFEGSTPNKIIPNLTSTVLPSCHYCGDKFEQDDLAIAIPERSDALYHTGCFKCHGCNQILADMFYFYDKESDNVYCGRDYAKIRGIPRCSACDELIFVKEYCLAENSTFHVKHFCCFECDKPLAGQNYVMENEQPVCVPCYELTKANKCYACKEVIHPDQQGLQLKDGVHFHASEDCFACKVCKKTLFGAKLLFRNDSLYCSHDCYNTDLQ